MKRAVSPITFCLLASFVWLSASPSFSESRHSPHCASQTAGEKFSEVFANLDQAEDAALNLENAGTARKQDPTRFPPTAPAPFDRQTTITQMRYLENGIDVARSTLARVPNSSKDISAAKTLQEMDAALKQAQYKVKSMKFDNDWLTKPVPANATKAELASYLENLDAEEEAFARESAQVGELVTRTKENLAKLSALSKIPYHSPHASKAPELRMQLATCVAMQDAQTALDILSQREEVKRLLASAKDSTSKKPLAVVLFQIGDEQAIQIFQTKSSTRGVGLNQETDKDYISEYRVNIKTGATRYGLY